MRESSIREHFTRGVKRCGGEAKKLNGLRKETDWLTLWCHPIIDFVELKSTDAKTKSGALKSSPRIRGQLREHARLRARGYSVFVLASKTAVDEYLKLRGTKCKAS